MINGRNIAEEISKKIANETKNIINILKKYPPKLAVIMVGSDYASSVYIKNKAQKANEVGIESDTIKLPEDISSEDMLSVVQKLNEDISVNGILVQLPLPKHLNSFEIINSIDPAKDVDCFHYENVGKFYLDKANFLPCTPAGCMYLIKTVQKELQGLNATVIGASNIVGKPMAQMLLKAQCTPSIVHINTKNIQEITSKADILVAAAGSSLLVEENWIKRDSILIDVGINRLKTGKIVGDINAESVIDKAQALTLVPGGVGPMTIIFLLLNTLKAFYNQNNMNIEKSVVQEIYKIIQ
ncbi:bifunctional 5,10-methylenetetrahydrofolate dehydrogenase/5,10-methenyltetrahydrofolate cyclohydrolase [Anaplasmataceae bacterium AB001_6]|nr:bifunctional 5,10-methylenetetrahydrofolate dehydrogenase/5,10-methenyltetrahydrofolate cyclohydrolase [Anaplasmataceae bacterium AB001_6]